MVYQSFARAATLALAFLLLPLLPAPSPALAHARLAGLQQADTTPALRWRLIARRLGRADNEVRRNARAAAQNADSTALRRLPPMVVPGRANALIAAAQYAAFDSVRMLGGGASRRLAIAHATAAVLERLYPAVRAELARELQRDAAEERASGVAAAAIDAGSAVGQGAALAIMEWAKHDGHDATWTGTIPTGPGLWRNAPGEQPVAVTAMLRRPWLLDSVAQFRLPPPPAFDSPEFKLALDEVRRVARERTPEQARIAVKWSEGGPPWWVDTTTDLLVRDRVSDDAALRLLTLMAIGGYDLFSACWDTKYHYWVIRPSQADTTIALVDGLSLPNFPAYPSGHACFAGFASTIIGHFMPDAAADVTRLAEENALSRLWGGVHYRFDNDAGLEIGRRVARYLIELEAKGELRARLRRAHSATEPRNR